MPSHGNRKELDAANLLLSCPVTPVDGAIKKIWRTIHGPRKLRKLNG
jgi:hypothetical protein